MNTNVNHISISSVSGVLANATTYHTDVVGGFLRGTAITKYDHTHGYRYQSHSLIDQL